MQGHKCLKNKIGQLSGMTARQDSKERIVDLPFTSLGFLKDCSEGKFNSPSHRASPKISRSRNSTRPNSCSEDELVHAMETFPDFFPQGYLSCNDSTLRTAAETQELLRGKIHHEEQIDRKVLDWLHQEYGIWGTSSFSHTRTELDFLRLFELFAIETF